MKPKIEQQIQQQYHRLFPSLDKRARRERAASEAMVLGHGGIALVHRASGLSPTMVGRSVRELQEAVSDRPNGATAGSA